MAIASYDPAEAALDAIERVCGARPIGCPWRGFTDPEVGEVLALYDDARVGDDVHVASVIALDPPQHALEGLRHYASAMRRMRANEDRLREERDG